MASRQSAVGIGPWGSALEADRPTVGRRLPVFVHQREIEQPVGVVVGRAQHLAARQVLVGRRDAAADRHAGGVDRLRRAEAGQGGAIGAHQEGGLDDVALRLLQRQRREIGIVERALVHDAGAGQRLLLADLRHA